MPLYEYECTACHKRTEKIQKFSDPEITICPKCGGVLERLISAPAIAFKGGGWYADGYGNARPNAKSGGSSESGSAESGGKDAGGKDAGSGSSESKPDTGSTGTPATAAPAPSAAPAAAAPAAATPSKN